MIFIIGLIVLGILLLIAELVLLPGVSIAGVGALLCYLGAISITFMKYGASTGYIIIGVIVVASIISTYFSLKATTWKRLSLKSKIEGTSRPSPQQQHINIGDSGKSISRLAPMGKVIINGESIEAKSEDKYLDPGIEIEVVGFDNFTVIVKEKSL